MKCFYSILIAAAALSCLATAINGATPQDLSVPFNDLLPPLEAPAADGQTAATTAAPRKTTTKRAAILAATQQLLKPTKKSYYQQQTQHIKELHLIDEDVAVQHDFQSQQKQLQNLHAGQQQQQRKPAQKSQGQQEKLQKQQQQQQRLQQNVQQQQRQHVAQNNNYKAKPQQHVAQHVAQPKQQQQHPQRSQQFAAVNFQPSTQRPPKSGLPTLTPFPRHLKN